MVSKLRIIWQVGKQAKALMVAGKLVGDGEDLTITIATSSISIDLPSR